MYLVYSGINKQYASAAVSTRHGKKTSTDYIYLGRIIDEKAGIFYNSSRGYFSFNLKTGEFGDPPADFVNPAENEKHFPSHYAVDFGDAFFVDAFLWKTGFMEVIDSVQYANKDTLHAMVLFYILSTMANCDAIYWYNGSITRMLYPRANLSSQRISDFLKTIGKPDNRMIFEKAYLCFLMNHYNPDKNILVDSTGLPNSIHMPQSNISVHNNVVSNGTRLIFVVQRSTGLPVYYQSIAGNIVDVSTLERVLLNLNSLGIDIDSCIVDAGYNSENNLNLFYNEDHECKIGFITRVRSDDKEYKQMILDELPDIERQENFVKYEDRYVFLVKKQVMTGPDKKNPAWMYLGYDCSRVTDEQKKLMKRAKKKKLTNEEVFQAMQTEGLFGILSGKEYSNEEILPAYYQRQAAEQIFDVAKNYTKLLPLRVNEPETYDGHLLLGFIASCAVKMIQLKLKTADLFLGSKLACLRNIKCTIYENRIVTDVPQKEARETFEALGMECPPSLPVWQGILQYDPPKAVYEQDLLSPEDEPEKKKRGRGRPKGSKNKATLAREAAARAAGTAVPEGTVKKRGRGRPKGSKNKSTLAREAAIAASQPAQNPSEKRKRGRPKGSKNKPKPYKNKTNEKVD